MGSRLELQTRLEDILGSRNCYFQPPASVQMKYPAIVYSLSNIDKRHANDEMYKALTAYQVILIDKDPDTQFLIPILGLQYCSFNRFYTSDNLNHWVFTLYN